MPSDEIKAHHKEEKPRSIRLLCFGCKRWTEVGGDGPAYVFTHDLGVFRPEDMEAKRAGQESGSFMLRHMTHCKRAIAAIRESDPRWVTLDEANREYETDDF